MSTRISKITCSPPVLIACFVAAILLLCPGAQALATTGLATGSVDKTADAKLNTMSIAKGANLIEAQKLFKVKDSSIIQATTPTAIKDSLAKAGSAATASSPWIVYAPTGNYAMSAKQTVPSNVIFVAENNSVFTPTTTNNFTQFFLVDGSLYGGTYECKNMAYYGLCFGKIAFSGSTNGTIRNATVKNPKKYGVVANNASTKNAKVLYCKVSNSGASGVSAVMGSHMSLVSNCTVTSSKESGINLGHANIDVISYNTLQNNKGHGISTDIDGSGGHKYCYIQTIANNTITGNGVNGVFIDKNCRVTTSFANNNVSQNKQNGLSVEANGLVKGIAFNTFSGNKSSNLRTIGKGTKAYIGNKNIFKKAGTNNITVENRSTVQLSGSNNAITLAKGNGISLKNRGSFVVKSGKKNQIKSNKGFGIRIEKKCTCKIANFVFGKNKTGAVKAYPGCKFTYKNCGLSTKAKAKNRIT